MGKSVILWKNGFDSLENLLSVLVKARDENGFITHERTREQLGTFSVLVITLT